MKYLLNTKIKLKGIDTAVYVIDNNQPNDDGFYFAQLYTEPGKRMGHATYSLESDHLFVSMQTNDNPDLARHIGIALDEHLFQQSLRLGRGGKLHKLASYDTHYFHWLQGFRAQQSQSLPQALLVLKNNAQNTSEINYLLSIYFDNRIAQLKSGERILSKDLGSLHMYLPEEIIAAWKHKYPIITPVPLTNKDKEEHTDAEKQFKSPTPLMKPESCSISYDDDKSDDDPEPTDDAFEITFTYNNGK